MNIDIWFFWRIFKKRWQVIIFTAFLAAILTGVFSKLFIPPTYTSSVSLYFGRVTESSSLERAITSSKLMNSPLRQISSDISIGETLSDDYLELINFEVIREGVRDELAKMGKWQNKPYGVSANLVKSSRIMNISVTGDDPVFCQELANIYARQFVEKIEQIIGIRNTQVIEEPALNLTPISPNIKKNIIFGFLAGFAVAFAYFVGMRLIDRTLKTSDEVESALNVPVVGTVHKDTEYALSKGKPLLFSGKIDRETQRSQIAEDFRVFRVNLINKKPDGSNDGSIIAVTSTNAQEGKTFCTANLGASLAEAGYKVLLVDCDTGKRGLQSYFGKADEKGLMNILSDETDFEHAVKRNLNDLNMDVLFCGNHKVNSANLMISPKFKELMEKLKKEYDYAFLDVSCHLGTADSVSAGSQADSVLLLVRSGKTESATAKQTVDALKRANLDVSGIILNGVEEE